MYYSIDSIESQSQYTILPRVYHWANANPKTFAVKEPALYCNGRRCKSRNYRSSRIEHRNAAELDSRATEFNLKQLPSNYRIFRGCLKFPQAPLSVNQMISAKVGWLEAKRSFSALLSDFRQRTGFDIQFRAKQHIVWSRRNQTDSVHYDWIGFHNIQLSEQRVRRMILDLWNRACMGQSTTHSAMVEIDRTDEQLHIWSNYTYKFAHNGTDEYQNFLRRFLLPSTRLPVTWESSGFWRFPPITQQIKFNGELKQVTSKGKRAAWVNYIRTFADDSIPEFETKDHRLLLRYEDILGDLIQDAELYHSHKSNTQY